MKEKTIAVRIAMLVSLIATMVASGSASATPTSMQDIAQSMQVGGVWNLSANIVVSYPSGYSCNFLSEIGDPYIPVTQSGNQIYADDMDPTPMPFVLQGTVNENSVVFTITGLGITPGDGDCSLASRNHSTTYSGVFDANTNTIQGNVSGWAQYSFERDEQGNYIWQLVTWTGTFIVNVEILTFRVIQLDALADVPIRDVSDTIWTDLDGDDNPEEKEAIADVGGGYLTLEATLDGFPSDPSWTPTVEYGWETKMYGDVGTNGQGSFTDLRGEFKVATPRNIGAYSLEMQFTIKDENGNVITSQTIDPIPLYVILDYPKLNLPKEAWFEKATLWAQGANTRDSTLSTLNQGIYWGGGWLYRDQELVAKDDWAKLVEGTKSDGNCVTFSLVWANLGRVLGVEGLLLPQEDGRYDHGFVTKPATSLPPENLKGNARPQGGSIDRWLFGMHQVGQSGSKYFDPTFGATYSTLFDFIQWHVESFSQPIIDLTDDYYIYKIMDTSPDYPWRLYEYRRGWSLSANIDVSYPSGYSCNFLSGIGDPYIPVIQSGNQIYAKDMDPTPMPFVLQGTINGNSVEFTITGFGITPGDGGCSLASRNFSTTYSGVFDASTGTIQGNVSGSGQYSFERDEQGNHIWQLVTWTGTFVVNGEILTFGIVQLDTRAYQAGQGVFAGNSTDYGLDRDSDGLYNALVIEAGVNVAVEGDFNVVGVLMSGDTQITARPSIDSSSFSDDYFSAPPGITTTTLTFSGQKVYDSGLDGPYTVNMTLLDENGSILDQASFATAAYTHTAFREIPSVILSSTDYGEDTDSDTLYNYLTTEITVETVRAMTYSVEGTLYAAGESIASATNSAYLSPGSDVIPLRFEGTEIRRSEADGPYTLMVVLYNDGDQQIGYSESSTAAYQYTDFQTSSASLADSYSDYGRDLDSDGLFDFLTLEVGVDATSTGSYTVIGWLRDNGGQDITFAITQASLGSGGQTVTLDFEGQAIYAHRVNGPYVISYVALHDGDDILVDNEHDAYTTAAYSYTQFERSYSFVFLPIIMK